MFYYLTTFAKKIRQNSAIVFLWIFSKDKNCCNAVFSKQPNKKNYENS